MRLHPFQVCIGIVALVARATFGNESAPPLIRAVRQDCSANKPCGRCEGHCKRDTDCAEGLICFYKDAGILGVDSVPGCLGSDLSFTDWCTVGIRNESDPLPLLKPPRACSINDKCGRCEGRCINDSVCEGDLVCFKKDNGLPGVDAVPGCLGEDTSQADWCTTKAAVEKSASAPTRAPNNVQPSLKPLVRAVRKDCSANKPCGRCEGHCKRDTDCAEGLICFYTDPGILGVDSVPGCLGSDLSFTDWCTVGIRKESDPLPLLKPPRACSINDKCGKCEGRCINDSVCEGDLVCFKKDNGLPGVDAVPGCLGEDTSQADWCTTKAAIDQIAKAPSALLPSFPPTGSPTQNPHMHPTFSPILIPFDEPLVFYVIADVPYNNREKRELPEQMKAIPGNADFVIHLGDIRGAHLKDRCELNEYEEVVGSLKMSKVPVLIVVGDNEWNDCSNTNQAWGYWEQAFSMFEDNWNHNLNVIRPVHRPENFFFVLKGTLFIGLNIVGGFVHDQNEWDTRLSEEASWTIGLMKAHTEGNLAVKQVRSVVIFAHANPKPMHKKFFLPLKQYIATVNVPVMYMNGDAHAWKVDPNFMGLNGMMRIQLRGGTYNPPLKVVVTVNDAPNVHPNQVFLYDRQLG